MTGYNVPSDTWTALPQAGVEVMHSHGATVGVDHCLDRSVVLEHSGWRVRAAGSSPHPDVLAYLMAELDHWKARAQHLERLVTQTIGVLEEGQSARVMGDADVPEPPVGTEYWWDGHRAWIRTTEGWRCSREGCTNCPTDWAGVMDFRDVTKWVRRLPGEPMPAQS